MCAGTHHWFMADIRAGYLVVEGCPECGARSSFFSTESAPPVDEYHEGEHFWIHMGSFQAVTFNLECSDCRTKVELQDMTALMLSTCEDPDCAVGRLRQQRGPGAWVYVALCVDSTHPSGRCVSSAGIEALNQYFNQSIEEPEREVVVVPCRLCNSIDKCRGIVIADGGLTDMYADDLQGGGGRARAEQEDSR